MIASISQIFLSYRNLEGPLWEASAKWPAKVFACRVKQLPRKWQNGAGILKLSHSN